MAVYFQERLRA